MNNLSRLPFRHRRCTIAQVLTIGSMLAAMSFTATALELTVTEREQAIVSALINHGMQADVQMVVLDGNTTGDPASIGEQEHAETILTELEVPPETLLDWQQRNRRISSIEYALDVDVSYQLLDRKTHRALFNVSEPESGWQAFFKRYPGAPGLIRVSHAGFDHSLKHALVYAEFQCGAECGSGRVVHLTDQGNNTWAVTATALVWIVQ